MLVTYDSALSNRQKQWAREALSLCEYPDFPAIDVALLVTVAAEPPCAGHKDYMCTTTDGLGGGTITIRENADDPDASFNAVFKAGGLAELKRFYLESVNHELGHVVSFTTINTDELKSQAAALFTRSAGAGEGFRAGTLDDWNPLDAAHGDRIQEAIAEAFKDAYLPDSVRVYENRSNWAISEADFITLMNMMLPPVVIDPGSEGYHSDDLYPVGIFSFIENPNDSDNGHGDWQGCSQEFRSAGVPAGTQFGVYEYPTFDMTGTDCAGAGILSADYFCMVECPTGHAPPAHVDNGTSGVPTHPVVTFPPDFAYGLEQQGFAPVSGYWDTNAPHALPNFPADETKDYYVIFMHNAVCSVADETPRSITIASITTYPKIGADLYPGEPTLGPAPDPPPYPYAPETVSGSQGDGQTMRFA